MQTVSIWRLERASVCQNCAARRIDDLGHWDVEIPVKSRASRVVSKLKEPAPTVDPAPVRHRGSTAGAQFEPIVLHAVMATDFKPDVDRGTPWPKRLLHAFGRLDPGSRALPVAIGLTFSSLCGAVLAFTLGGGPAQLATRTDGKRPPAIESSATSAPAATAKPVVTPVRSSQASAALNAIPTVSPVQQQVATDGQRLGDQPPDTQDIFRAVWGSRAAATWVAEHNLQLSGSGR